jgi:hypothetical protein
MIRTSKPTSRSWRAIAVALLAVLLSAWPGIDGRAQAAGEVCLAETDLVAQAVCYGQVSTAENDLQVCDEAEHPGVRFQCYYIYAQHSRDPMICESIPDSLLRDSCLSDVAAGLADATLCRNVGDAGVRDSCYYDTARKTGDRGLCAEIDDPALKHSCADAPD